MEEVPPSPEVVKLKKIRRKTSSKRRSRLSLNNDRGAETENDSILLKECELDTINSLETRVSSVNLPIDPPAEKGHTDLLYFDVDTERVEQVKDDPLASAALLEKANQLESRNGPGPSNEFLANVKNKFMKVNEVLESTPEKSSGSAIDRNDRLNTSIPKKSNYSYTQFDLDTQMMGIWDAADMLAEDGMKDWSSPLKQLVHAPSEEPHGLRQKPKENVTSEQQTTWKKDRWKDIRQSAFSRESVNEVSDIQRSIVPTNNVLIKIQQDFSEGEEINMAVDYSIIKSTPLRKRLSKIQDYIDSPPQTVKKASIRRTFSKRKGPVSKPVVIRRLSYESDDSSEANHLPSELNTVSSDEEMQSLGDPSAEQLVASSVTPDIDDNFNSSVFMKANINQLSQFFSQSLVDSNEKHKRNSESLNREPPFYGFPSSPTTPISIRSTDACSPQTLNISWLFRESTDSGSELEEAEQSCKPFETCPTLHTMLDDDEDFLVQLTTSQKNPGDFCKSVHQTVDVKPEIRATPIQPVVFTGGFQTAGGSGIKVSNDALSKARTIWEEEETKFQSALCAEATFSGFQNSAQQQDKVLDHLKAHYGKFNEGESSTNGKMSSNGFQTATGRSISVSEKSLAKAKTMLQEMDNEILQAKPTSNGFQTAGGRSISVSEHSLAKAKNMLLEVDNPECSTHPNEIVPKQKCNRVSPVFGNALENSKTLNETTGNQCLGFQTARGNAVKVSDEALSKAQYVFQQLEKDDEMSKGQLQNIHMNGFQTAKGKSLTVTEHGMAKARSILDQIELETHINIKRRRDSDCLEVETPIKKSRSDPETSMINRHQLKESVGKPYDIDNFFGDLDDQDFHQLFCPPESAPIEGKRSSRPSKQVCLANRFDECDRISSDPKKSPWDDSFGEIVAKLSPDLNTELKPSSQTLETRRLARFNQLKYIQNKPVDARRTRITDFVQKKQLHNRCTLEQFVGGCKPNPGKISDEDVNQTNFVTAENAEYLKFNMVAVYGKSQCEENVDGFAVGESEETETRIHLDDSCSAGVAEMSNAFLAHAGIDPALVPDGWILNSWKWILVKLSSMERNFSDFFREMITPQNVLDQLLYRYHVEIDCAKRSVIRKIVEKDDIAGKRMVLFVSRVFRGQNPSDIEIELCDGWYPIRTVLDSYLIQAVLNGKICVGTKLMTQGADLLNLAEACPPLEVPLDVRLRIHANSTRRVKWSTKLGLYRVPASFYVSCNNILERGGLVVSLEVVIVRVYPLMYVDKSQKELFGSVLRSERVERKRTLADDTSQSEIVQGLFSQIQKEVEAEKCNKRISSLCSKISKSTTVAELIEMMDAGMDLSVLEFELSTTQREAVMNYQQHKQEEIRNEINRRVKERMAGQNGLKRKVAALLKVRVMDARKPEKVLLLSIWRPPEYLSDIIQEKKFLKIHNATANGTRNGEIQLTTGKNSSFSMLSPTKYELPVDQTRKLTKISEIDVFSFKPLFNEFDTIGVVVQIGVLESKKFQLVYFADSESNLLCVNFWSGIKEYAYEDLIKERTVLCISNLQWRTINALSAIPNSFATEYTTFSECSKLEHFSEELTRFQTLLNAQNFDTFYDNCRMKILEMKDRKLSRQSNTFTPDQIHHNGITTPLRTVLKSYNSFAGTPNDFSPGVGQPVSLQKRKIEQLAAAYKSPPKLTPIVMRSNPRVRKSFRNPARLEDRMNRAECDDH
ncbi:breast cancer type 2 susceptibility protein homolog [Uranotaenia lowii]|uniref:breast cancer type 2 susceptibility protein homolog n=1 Tax=Uranotaenia lowii TaxID=190385 RepID=UPI0024799B1C|nr:breast cancer type 2 susceptibility protein homolog [Uranotaenia lowii]